MTKLKWASLWFAAAALTGHTNVIVGQTMDDRVPLFSESDLAQAFCFIMSKDEASRIAREWFQAVPDDSDVDENGLYLYEDITKTPGFPPEFQNIPWVYSEANESSEPEDSAGYKVLGDLLRRSPEEHLLTLTNLHLGLLSLVSPELARRIQRIRGLSDAEAERQRLDAMRTARLLSGTE